MERKSLTRIGSLLIVVSVVALMIGGSWFTATGGWSPAMQKLGALCFWFWWIPGVIGGVMNSLTLRSP
jgi:hypothetical protein